EGLSDPAPVSDGYRRALSAVFESKAKQSKASEEGAAAHGDKKTQGKDAEAERQLEFFIEAQSTWDRAFAEAIAAARDRKPRPLVVGIVGRGHVEHGYGLPRQLEDLGIDDVATVLTHAANEPCERLAPDDGVRIADAVFGLDDEPERGHGGGGPRLGVMIESFGKGDDAAVRVASVMDGSVAQSTGLKPGDLIVEAAGVRTTKSGELIAVVRRQAPGTWLPLSVRRDGDDLALVAKFPTAP
ncbi:MAG: ChaN family lipoprotein, partial [Alphaproteobacteria bacterium]|nr:ChaN family lipoprotein [Alphaproteobacteria bacterium]